MSFLIDTHAHINYEPLVDDLVGVISRAEDKGVKYVICPGTDLKTSAIALDISARFDNVFAAAGIHPHDSQDLPHNWEKQLNQLLDNERVIAVGEIGLDFYRDYAPQEVQLEVFRKQVEIARKRKMPMIIHNRRADQLLKEILEEVHYYYGVLHCFSSNQEFAEQMLQKGLFISFTGNITYKSKKLRRVLLNIPLDRFFLETDSPFITPLPEKGFPNEPANLIQIARKVAELKEIEYDSLTRITSQNAIRFFHLPL